MKRVLLLAAAMLIPAIVIADAAPRKASSNQKAAETTGVATPDAPIAQPPARRARAAVQPAVGVAPLTGAGNTQAGAQSTIQVGNQCFRPTDSSRGFGYWTSCDQVYSFVLGKGDRTRENQLLYQLDRGSDGGDSR